MRVLLVKLTSLGDVVHAFPALSDALRAVPGLKLDWAVDEAFAPIARLHPAVRRVLALPQRKLMKALLRNPLKAWRSQAMRAARAELSAEPYDIVIDAQGLLKSALVARLASGVRHGFDRASAREGFATLLYDRRHHVPETEHMATRIRRLFAAALGYRLDGLPEDSGLRPAVRSPGQAPHLIFLHGTTWPTKTWTLEGWRALARAAEAAGLDVVVLAHGAEEEARAAAIAADLPNVVRPPAGPLDAQVPFIAFAAGAVSVDTGLGHLAAAFGVPTVGLYGPTNPTLTGLVGARVAELKAHRPCAPCESNRCRIAPDTREGPPCLADHDASAVWAALLRLGLRSGASTAETP